jgi:branched-chain amino acid transport system substrate-binding protein
MKRGMAAALGAALLGLFCRCGPAPGPGLRVGVLLPLSGPDAPYGASFTKGCVLAMAEELTRPPGSGAPFELRYRDVGADPRDADRAFREMAAGGDMPAVIAVSSAVTLASGTAANQTRTVLMSALGTSPEITLLGDFVYRTGTSALQDGIALAQFCVQHRLDRVAVLYPDDPQGQGLSQVFRDSLQDKGGTLGDVLPFTPGEQEFKAILDVLKKSRPQVVYLPGTASEALAFLRQAQARGLRMQLLGTCGMYVNDLLRRGEGLAEGAVFTQPAYDPLSEDELTRRFVQRFGERYGEVPDLYSAAAYDACRLLIAAVRVGGRDTAAVRRALDAMEGFEGVLGQTTFDKNGDATRVPQLTTVLHGVFTRLR